MSSLSMRLLHRYLGFFLAGIMAVYALSGIVLIYRDTDFLKVERKVEKQLSPNIVEAEVLAKELKIRGLKIDEIKNDVVYFKTGSYNQLSGVASFSKKELPYVLDRMTHFHKAKSSQPLFWLNTIFGLCLLTFVVSSFWMFLPKTKTFKQGIYFVLAGVVLTLVLLFV